MAGGNSDSEPLSTEVPISAKRRRKKSQVWEHFSIEAVAGGCTRARCNLCEQTFAYSSGSKIAGTSHLKRHITLGSCPMIKNQERKSLALASLSAPPPSLADGNATPDLPRRRYRGSGWAANAPFDQENSSFNLARMIVLHEYPLHMVEHPGFVSFVQGLQARFKAPNSGEIEGEILSLYLKEKRQLLQVLGTMSSRINLTVGLWTTSQTLGYVGLAGQFIDGDWKLQRRMLNFVIVSSPYFENAISEAIGVCLADWNVAAKLFAITLDNNCSSHDIYGANLRDRLASRNDLLPKGQLFVVRCYAHILNVIARDVIASIHGIIYNIRESVKYVNSSKACEEKFYEMARQMEIPESTRKVSLDVSTHWDTTYHMLATALEYCNAFRGVDTCDDSYNELPSSEDWKKLEVVCALLKLLYDSANVVAGTVDPTANIFFHEAWKLQYDLSNAVKNGGEMVSSVAGEMLEKFDKYWKDCSLVLAVAVAMDPRFKVKLVEFSFTKIYGVEDAPKYVKVVDDCIHELYHEYVSQPLPLTPAYVEANGSGSGSGMANDGGGAQVSTPTISVGDGLLDFDIYISEMSVNQHCKSELDQYLEESLVPRIQEFDILNWWKLNTLKFPTLSKMARDVLAIPMSMLAPGASIFAAVTGSMALDEYRSSLSPEVVEALFCTKDWLQSAQVTEPDMTNAVVKMEY